MNIEFHYYAIHYLARQAGFSESESSILAISSQLVDESTAQWEIHSNSINFSSEITQNYIFWNPVVAESMYRPFHFIPGEREIARSRRKDGKPGKYPVTADSPLAREILVAALDTHDLYRIGIALHAYADTWAHQNFSADDEPQNALESGVTIPAVGHLHAFKNPDNPRTIWKDSRLLPPFDLIDNTERYAKAAGMIYRFLCTYHKKKFKDEPFVVEPLEEIWKTRAGSDSAGKAADYIIQLDVPPYETEAWAKKAKGEPNRLFPHVYDPYTAGYNRLTWLATATVKAGTALGSKKGKIDERDYRGSEFELWNKAALAHRSLCRQKFFQRGIR
jgi:hypothetical protein